MYKFLNLIGHTLVHVYSTSLVHFSNNLLLLIITVFMLLQECQSCGDHVPVGEMRDGSAYTCSREYPRPDGYVDTHRFCEDCAESDECPVCDGIRFSKALNKKPKVLPDWLSPECLLCIIVLFMSLSHLTLQALSNTQLYTPLADSLCMVVRNHISQCSVPRQLIVGRGETSVNWQHSSLRLPSNKLCSLVW